MMTKKTPQRSRGSLDRLTKLGKASGVELNDAQLQKAQGGLKVNVKL